LLFLLLNVVLLLCAFNPWTSAWQAQAITVLVVEAVLVGSIGLPAIVYQMVWRKKTFRQSLGDTIEAVLNVLASIV
jgi:hypothetical protein